MAQGKFLVFDGGEGAGKTTVIKRLKELYGDRIAVSHEPGGCSRAEAIRTQLLSKEGKDFSPEKQFELFWQARRFHMEDVVIPMLRQKELFICDRFDSSTWAYQIYAQQQPELRERFWELRTEVLGQYTPDCYVIFKLPPEEAKRRVAERGGRLTHFDEAGLEFYRAVMDGLIDFTKQTGITARVIDAEKPREDVFEQASLIVQEFMQK